MSKARKMLVSLEVAHYYHCVSRCVRCAFLCGENDHSDQTYDQRGRRIQDWIGQLASVFAIDVCTYAVMPNHYHVVLYIDRAQADAWHNIEVVRRWRQLFTGHPLAEQLLDGETVSQAESRLL